MIDPASLTLVQNTFLQHTAESLHIIAHYALGLLTIFAALELAVFGIIWAIYHSTAWEQLFFKILKIGLILMLIQNYSYLINVIIQGFAQMGGVVANVKNLHQYVLNPAHIWKYGYDGGLSLLKAATATPNIGLALTLVTLGIGILLSFALLGIQIVLQVVGFYVLTLIALIFLPFGAFSPSSNMFDKSIHSIFKAGVRVMVLILVVGVAVTVFQGFGEVAKAGTSSINQPLGLFFTALLFTWLAIFLPKYATEGIGKFTLSFKKGEAAAPQVVREAYALPAAGGAAVTPMAAATQIQPFVGAAAAPVTMASGAQLGQATSVTATVTPTGMYAQPGAVMGAAPEARGARAELGKAVVVEKSVSDMTLKKIKKSFMEALKEQRERKSD